jgi:hypothetical protein
VTLTHLSRQRKPYGKTLFFHFRSVTVQLYNKINVSNIKSVLNIQLSEKHALAAFQN